MPLAESSKSRKAYWRNWSPTGVNQAKGNKPGLRTCFPPPPKKRESGKKKRRVHEKKKRGKGGKTEN